MNSDSTDTPDRRQADRGPSQLFLVRVWLDDEPGENGWHGRVQHPVTGEAHPFRTCAELREAILKMMAPQIAGPSADEPELQTMHSPRRKR